MSNDASLDQATAHREFSTSSFNLAWEHLDKATRTPEDDAMLLHLVHTSLWHWLQREDCKPRNLSIGCWQVSRAYAVIGDAANARRFGELCLKHSADEPPFFLAYAHEALARAAKVAGDAVTMRHHLAEATTLAGQVTGADDRGALEKDIAEIAE